MSRPILMPASADEVPGSVDLRPAGTVGAVVHAVRILRHLATVNEPVGVASIARETGTNTSTCFNILRTLTRERLVAFRGSDKTYTLGLGLAQLATALVGISHAELFRPEMERLVQDYEMLVVLWRITDDGRHMIHLDQAAGQLAIRVEVRDNLRLPALVGSLGRCVASALALPDDVLRERFNALRWQVPLSFDVYAADVAEVRDRGWAIDEGYLHKGLHSVGAVVNDAIGKPRFGISGVTIAGQHSRDRLHQLGEDLKEVAVLSGAALFPKSRRDLAC